MSTPRLVRAQWFAEGAAPARPATATRHDLPEAVLFGAFFVLLNVSWLVDLPGLSLTFALREAAMVAVGAAASALVSWRFAVALAVLAWTIADGFVVHRYGTLGWDGRVDLVRLAVYLLACLAACACGRRAAATR